RGSRGSEREASQSGLLPDLLHGAGFRILAPLQVSGDGGPATTEASYLLAPAHDQDATPIPEDRGNDGRGPHAGEFHGPPGAVEDDPVARPETRDVDPIHHRDSRQDRPDRDDALGRGIHDSGRPHPSLREPVDHVRSDRAPFPVGEREDATREPFVCDARRRIEDLARDRVSATDEGERDRTREHITRGVAGDDSPTPDLHAYRSKSRSMSSRMTLCLHTLDRW